MVKGMVVAESGHGLEWLPRADGAADRGYIALLAGHRYGSGCLGWRMAGVTGGIICYRDEKGNDTMLTNLCLI